MTPETVMAADLAALGIPSNPPVTAHELLVLAIDRMSKAVGVSRAGDDLLESARFAQLVNDAAGYATALMEAVAREDRT